jgi:hypothetical protein
MRKPAEVRSDADLQAIQTSVAFKNISDAIEQYRRQFGLAFLALIAFSAIHVGLVVIANLYTLETRVQGGVLSSASSDAQASRPVAVGTAAAQQVTDLAFIMTNLNEAEQKSSLSRLQSVDFVDASGDYRQYTVTGFQLGGWKRSELKLYTSVGHVLSFVRGKGLRVFSENGESSCNCTAPVESRRQLLGKGGGPASYDIFITDEIAANDACVYDVISDFSQLNYRMVGGVATGGGKGRKLLQDAYAVMNQVVSSSMGAGAFTQDSVDLGGLAEKISAGDYTVTSSADSIEDWGSIHEAEAYLNRMQQCLTNPGNMSPQEYTLYYLNKDLQELVAGKLNYGTQWCTTSMWGGITTCNVLNGKETTVAQIGSFADSECLAEAEKAGAPDCLFCQERFGGDQQDKIDAAIALNNFINQDLPSAASLDQFAYDVQTIMMDKYGAGIVEELSAMGLATDTATDISMGKDLLFANPPRDLAMVQNEIQDMVSLVRNFIVGEASSQQQACEQTNAEFMNTYSRMQLEGLIAAAQSQDQVAAVMMNDSSAAREAARIAETASDAVSNCESRASACIYEANNEWFSTYMNNGEPVPQCLDYVITSDQVNLQHGKTTFQHIMATRTFSTQRCCDDWSCPSDTIYNYYYHQQIQELNAITQAGVDAAQASVMWENEFAALSNNKMSAADAWTVGGQSALTDTSSRTGTEVIQALINDVSATLSEQVTTLTNEWNDFKTDLVWTAFKEAPTADGTTTLVSGSGLQQTWGCSSTTQQDIIDALSPINIYAYDACHVTEWMTVRKPFVTGVMFSYMQGGFDSYSLFLSQTFCSQLEGLVSGGSNFWYIPSPSFLNDYVIMLHGWGGSYDFLHLSAAVLFYGTFGVGSGYGPRSFYPCNNKDDMEHYGEDGVPACITRGAPGGLMVMSPDGGQCPLPQKTLWINSEFSGHILDFVVFELPSYLLGNLGMNGRAFGLFGCSMGGFGSFQAAMKYPHVVNAIGAFNSPIYPQDCHFGYTCHHVCATNMILCELVFTSGNQAMNAYVILFSGSLVVSTSSTDPVSWGEAVHMSENGGFVECKFTSAQDLIGATGTLVSEYQAGSKFLTIEDTVTIGSDGKVCQYQDWEEQDSYDEIDPSFCAKLFTDVVSVDPGRITDEYSTTFGSSGRWTFDTSLNYDGANPHFDCDASSCHQEFTMMILPYLPCVGGICSGTGGDQLCSQFHCSDTKWCVEGNLAADSSTGYLDGVAVTASIMKFVTPYHPTDDMPIVSAWGRQLFTMPSMLIFHKVDLWNEFTLIIFLHCSQNDEFMLFPMFVDITSMLQYASEFNVDYEGTATDYPAFNSKSRFVVDFGDCDYHHFSERDMKMGNLFFADALRGYTQDFMGLNTFTTSAHTQFRMCWMPAYGINAIYGSTGGGDGNLLDNCALQWYGENIQSFFDANGEFNNVYSVDAWGLSSSHNTVHQDTEAVKDMEEEALKELDDHTNPCQIHVGDWLTEQFVQNRGSVDDVWFNIANPAHTPGTDEYVCQTSEFVYDDEHFDEMMGDAEKDS